MTASAERISAQGLFLTVLLAVMVRVSEEPSQAGEDCQRSVWHQPQSSPAGSVTSVEELKPQAIIVPQLFRLTLA